jgi:hypothetical protein
MSHPQDHPRPFPTAEEISPIPQDLDGRVAVRHFLGKTEDQAMAMFVEAFEQYSEDFLGMGPVAFGYCFPVAVRYAESDTVRLEPSVADTLLGIMRHRHRWDRPSLDRLLPLLTAYVDGVVARVGQMRVERHCYGNLAGKYRRFLQKLLAEAPPAKASP